MRPSDQPGGLSALAVLRRIRLVTLGFGVLSTASMAGQLGVDSPGLRIAAVASMAALIILIVATGVRGRLIPVVPLAVTWSPLGDDPWTSPDVLFLIPPVVLFT